jgi:hypothetical protein
MLRAVTFAAVLLVLAPAAPAAAVEDERMCSDAAATLVENGPHPFAAQQLRMFCSAAI